jgi:hypothetical protein
VWLDDALQPGQPAWVRAIEASIESCAALVLVMSPASAGSDWVDRELDLAEELRKPILPLLLSGRCLMRARNLQTEDVSSGALPSDRFIAALRHHTQAATT